MLTLYIKNRKATTIFSIFSIWKIYIHICIDIHDLYKTIFDRVTIILSRISITIYIYLQKTHNSLPFYYIDLHTNAKSFGIFTESRFEGSLPRWLVKIDADKTIIEEINCETRTMQFFIQHRWISVFIATWVYYDRYIFGGINCCRFLTCYFTTWKYCTVVAILKLLVWLSLVQSNKFVLFQKDNYCDTFFYL